VLTRAVQYCFYSAVAFTLRLRLLTRAVQYCFYSAVAFRTATVTERRGMLYDSGGSLSPEPPYVVARLR
jgi:hypothetical protein